MCQHVSALTAFTEADAFNLRILTGGIPEIEIVTLITYTKVWNYRIRNPFMARCDCHYKTTLVCIQLYRTDSTEHIWTWGGAT